MSPRSPYPFAPGLRLGGIVAALAIMAGCASVPPPDDAMAAAQTQLQAARDAHAADYAPVDLDFAQSRFDRAQAAMDAQKYAQASDLAAESQADSRLALTRAELGALRAQIKSLHAENERLRAQLVQPRQAMPPPPPEPVDQGTQGAPPAAGSPDTMELPQQVLPAPAASSGSAGDDDGMSQGGGL